jgi:hypothetical protein
MQSAAFQIGACKQLRAKSRLLTRQIRYIRGSGVSRQLDRLAKVAVEKRLPVPIPNSMSALAMMRHSGIMP